MRPLSCAADLALRLGRDFEFLKDARDMLWVGAREGGESGACGGPRCPRTRRWATARCSRRKKNVSALVGACTEVLDVGVDMEGLGLRHTQSERRNPALYLAQPGPAGLALVPPPRPWLVGPLQVFQANDDV